MRDLTPLLLAQRVPPALHPSPVHPGGGAGSGAAVDSLEADWLARLPAPDARGFITGGSVASADLVEHSVTLSSFRAMFRRPLTVGQDKHRRHQLVRRGEKREAGLSNTAYWAAITGTQKIRLKVTPARVKVTLSDPLADLQLPERPGGGKRGVIRELSDAARDRLADCAATLEAEGRQAEVMLTLTAPGNWEQLYVYDPETGEALEGGALFKAHMKAFKKRLERFLVKLGVPSWSALWFLEFQQRGAPHVHLILFDCSLAEPLRRSLRSWCGRAWSSVVGNPSAHELEKHRRAGTQVARMKKKHFGYAKKYASKMQQKEVPADFKRVGRFWGVWNYTSPAPIYLDVDYSRFNEDAGRVFSFLADLLATVDQYSPEFAASRLGRAERALTRGLKRKIGFSVYGTAGVEVALGADL